MWGGSGGGSSIIAAYAVVKAFLRPGRSVDASEEQAALDREELREVEYEEMGLSPPKQPVEQSITRRILRALGRR